MSDFHDRILEIAAEMSGRPLETLEPDELVEDVFQDKKQRHRFVLRAVEASRRDKAFAFGLWRKICRTPDPARDRELTRESLGILSNFRTDAKVYFYERTWRLQKPTLSTFSATLEARKPIYSEIEGDWAHHPIRPQSLKLWFVGLGLTVLGFPGILAASCFDSSDPLSAEFVSSYLRGLLLAIVLVAFHLAMFFLPGWLFLMKRGSSPSRKA